MNIKKLNAEFQKPEGGKVDRTQTTPAVQGFPIWRVGDKFGGDEKNGPDWEITEIRPRERSIVLTKLRTEARQPEIGEIVALRGVDFITDGDPDLRFTIGGVDGPAAVPGKMTLRYYRKSKGIAAMFARLEGQRLA